MVSPAFIIGGSALLTLTTVIVSKGLKKLDKIRCDGKNVAKTAGVTVNNVQYDTSTIFTLFTLA
ncbi:unnamed protein product, partial [Rotaria sp. Silwood1]